MSEDYRYSFIDWCKVIGIILVVIGHSYTDLISHKIIYLFHMPLFFIISGFLYRNKGLKGELNGSLYSLAIPYLIFNAIYMIPFTGGEFKTSYIFDILIGNQERLCGLMVPLWFLVSLFVIRAFCVLFDHIGWKHLLFSLLASFIVFKFLGIRNGDMDPFQIKTSCFALPFFLIGSIAKPYLSRIRDLRKASTITVTILAFTLSVMLGLYNMHLNNNHAVGIFECNFGKYISLYYISSSMTALCIIILCFLLLDSRWKVIETLSNGTLFILCTHLMIKWKIMRFFTDNWLSTFLSTIIIVFISYFLILFCHRFFPLLLGKKCIKTHAHL